MLKLLDSDPAQSVKPPEQPQAPANAAGKVDGAPAGDNKQDPQGEPGKPGNTETDPKKQKDNERFDRNWKKFQEERDKFHQEQKAREQDLKELEEFRRSKVEQELSSQAAEYERIAKEFEEEGKSDAAAYARQKASEARNSAAQKVQQAKQEQFMALWRNNYSKAAEENPDLHDDESSLYKGVEALLKAEPVLRSMPDGINKAVSFVKATMASEENVKLKERNAELQSRIDELTQKLTPGGSGPANLSANKTFDDMSQQDRKAFILAKMIAGES